MVFLMVLFFAGGRGVLKKRKRSAFAGDIRHFGLGNISFDLGK